MRSPPAGPEPADVLPLLLQAASATMTVAVPIARHERRAELIWISIRCTDEPFRPDAEKAPAYTTESQVTRARRTSIGPRWLPVPKLASACAVMHAELI